MKTYSIFAAIFLLTLTGTLCADVSVTELDDCIRVTIDGQIFTEWRHKDWASPYLYPIIGPNGENITRHFPMKQGMPGAKC